MTTSLPLARWSPERRLAVAAFLSLFGVLCAQTLLETARDTLFLTHVPVARLPWVYLTLASLTLVAGGLSPRIARWRDRGWPLSPASSITRWSSSTGSRSRI
jgi:hypothetical protein